MHAETLRGQVGRILGLFASMHWSLVTFDDDWLITCDQPVLILPTTNTTITPKASIPATGFANTMEVCFTVDPRKLLLMTWRDDHDSQQPIRGEFRHACSVNAGLRSQTAKEWISRPGSTPPFVAPPMRHPNLYAISTELLPGYTVPVAVGSRRRTATDAMVAALIEENAPRDRARWVGMT